MNVSYSKMEYTACVSPRLRGVEVKMVEDFEILRPDLQRIEHSGDFVAVISVTLKGFSANCALLTWRLIIRYYNVGAFLNHRKLNF